MCLFGKKSTSEFQNKILISAFLSILNVLFWKAIGQAIGAITTHSLLMLPVLSLQLLLNRLGYFVVTLLNQYDDILFDKMNKYKPVATAIHTVSKKNLEEIESPDTAFLFTTADLHFQKWQDAREFFSSSTGMLVYIVALVVSSIRLKFSYLSLLIIPLFISYAISMKSAKATGGFWKQYNKNSKKFNYFSDVLLKSEFAHERKTFNFFSFFSENFHREFDLASKTNSTLAYRRFAYQSIAEIFLLFFSIASLIALVHMNSTNLNWLGNFTYLNFIFGSMSLASSTFFDLFPKLRDFNESSKILTELSNLNTNARLRK